MGVNHVKHILNLKTGFFKTEVYTVLLTKDKIKLFSKNGSSYNIIINYADIKSVSIYRGMPVEIELRTENKKYLGTLPKTEDAENVIISYKSFLGKKLLY